MGSFPGVLEDDPADCAAVARMSTATCRIDRREISPGCRCAHPGYACLLVIHAESSNLKILLAPYPSIGKWREQEGER
jgi:hypothetical protein